MKNGRCHLHGGKSTGSKTPEGKLIQKIASWKHEMRSKEEMNKTIKEEMPDWVATMDRYDDPEVTDMAEVWDL